jgi:hypothetical protein
MVSPQRPNKPTFPFPISHQNEVDNLNKITTLVLPKFYGLVIEEPHTFLFEFISFVEAMIIPLMLIGLNYFLLLLRKLP